MIEISKVEEVTQGTIYWFTGTPEHGNHGPIRYGVIIDCPPNSVAGGIAESVTLALDSANRAMDSIEQPHAGEEEKL